MAPHTITHCIPKVCVELNCYHICQKTIEFYLYIQVPNITSKM